MITDRFKQQEMFLKFRMLQKNPHYQAEVIAEHYLKLSTLAQELSCMIKVRRHGERSTELDECIERLKHEFVEHHRKDFGIELSWNDTPEQS